MDKQQIFDKVCTHLLKQNARCVYGEDETPKYIHPDNGMKCAIGCLIDESSYSPDVEGVGLCDMYSLTSKRRQSRVDMLFAMCGIERTIVNEIFLYGLQNIHDETAPRLWAKELRNFAKENGLEQQALAGVS